MRFFRPTLRVRMALLYGGLVLLVGISLLFTCVILIDNSISSAYESADAAPKSSTADGRR